MLYSCSLFSPLLASRLEQGRERAEERGEGGVRRGEGERGEGCECVHYLTARSKFSASQLFWPPAIDENGLKTIRPSPFSPSPSPSVFA